MSYRAIVFNVMIASPSDVASERNIIRDVIHEWNAVGSETRGQVLLPIGWETHSTPEMGGSAQSILNKQILERCDLLVGVFWTRIGTATEEYASGTVEEIRKHVEAGKPAMIYFSSQPALPDSIDPVQYQQLKEFKVFCKKNGLYETFNDYTDFRNKFNRQLQLKLNQTEYFESLGDFSEESPLELNESPIPSLSKEAITLLKEASQDKNGRIYYMKFLGGSRIQTNGKQFVQENNARILAVWNAAIEELENSGLLSDVNGKREIFAVTRQGYEVSDIVEPT